ncbi:TPA: MMPL family transporter, partial [Bacillus anthracis]|nr:MMPL family transporter [Bacillus anthracis]
IQVLVQFGIVTAIGVLLDTFIVRPLLVPAITVVLGRFAFWPGKLSRKSEEVQKVDA